MPRNQTDLEQLRKREDSNYRDFLRNCSDFINRWIRASIFPNSEEEGRDITTMNNESYYLLDIILYALEACVNENELQRYQEEFDRHNVSIIEEFRQIRWNSGNQNTIDSRIRGKIEIINQQKIGEKN